MVAIHYLKFLDTLRDDSQRLFRIDKILPNLEKLHDADKILKFLVTSQVVTANIHEFIKFYQNGLNNCRDIKFIGFQYGSHLDFEILVDRMVGRANIHHCTKFNQN